MLAGQAGMLPAHALAHGTISPTSARHGSTQSFVVVVPNISVHVPLTGFRLTPPEGVDVEAEEDPAAGPRDPCSAPSPRLRTP